MNYFLLEVHEAFRPLRFEDWFGKLDKNGAKFTSNREVFTVTDLEQMVYTDVVMHPCFMVSLEFKKVVEMYQPHLPFQRIIVMNQKKKVSKAYYIPILRESSLQAMQHPDAGALMKAVIKDKVHIFARLDLVESLLRRKMIGIGLKEVTDGQW